jgi:hypothetical protein
MDNQEIRKSLLEALKIKLVLTLLLIKMFYLQTQLQINFVITNLEM